MLARPVTLLVVLAAACALCGCVTDFRVRKPAVSGLPRDDARAPVSAVWIGHASVLLRLGDKVVLADGNFSNHQFVYPRLTPASLRPEQVPPVDLALVSHLHGDHFDVAGLKRLASCPAVVLPAGAEGYTRGLPGEAVLLAPWESREVHGVKVTAVPARHSGGRFLVDGLWNRSFSGYVLEADGHAAYFAGDTGYDPRLFKEIGRRFPDLDVAFVPIAPARGGNSAHASPAEAVQIFRDTGARYLVPIHYEAFYSSVVPYDEPRRLLAEAAAKVGVADRVFALHTGERLVLPDDAQPWVIDELPARSSAVALHALAQPTR